MTTDIKHETDHTATAHTPGTWEDNGTGLIYGRVSGDDGEAPFVADVCRDGASGSYSAEERANARLIATSPALLTFAATIARMTRDGEDVEGREFVMENDEAVGTLNALIDEARVLVAEAKGLAA